MATSSPLSATPTVSGSGTFETLLSPPTSRDHSLAASAALSSEARAVAGLAHHPPTHTVPPPTIPGSSGLMPVLPGILSMSPTAAPLPAVTEPSPTPAAPPVPQECALCGSSSFCASDPLQDTRRQTHRELNMYFRISGERFSQVAANCPGSQGPFPSTNKHTCIPAFRTVLRRLGYRHDAMGKMFRANSRMRCLSVPRVLQFLMSESPGVTHKKCKGAFKRLLLLLAGPDYVVPPAAVSAPSHPGLAASPALAPTAVQAPAPAPAPALVPAAPTPAAPSAPFAAPGAPTPFSAPGSVPGGFLAPGAPALAQTPTPTPAMAGPGSPVSSLTPRVQRMTMTGDSSTDSTLSLQRSMFNSALPSSIQESGSSIGVGAPLSSAFDSTVAGAGAGAGAGGDGSGAVGSGSGTSHRARKAHQEAFRRFLAIHVWKGVPERRVKEFHRVLHTAFGMRTKEKLLTEAPNVASFQSLADGALKRSGRPSMSKVELDLYGEFFHRSCVQQPVPGAESMEFGS